MSEVTSVTASQNYPSPVLSPKGTIPAASSANNPEPLAQDVVDLSPAAQRETMETGRIALNAQAGNLTAAQASQLYQQVASIQTQITSDKQAGGGTLSSQDAQSINQLQNQLSATIYSDAHNGAAPPTSHPPISEAEKRAAMQAGRIELNEQAGNLNASQTQQLMSQQTTIDQLIGSNNQANGGTLTQSEAQQINQLQNQASRQIYETAHPSAT